MAGFTVTVSTTQAQALSTKRATAATVSTTETQALSTKRATAATRLGTQTQAGTMRRAPRAIVVATQTQAFSVTVSVLALEGAMLTLLNTDIDGTGVAGGDPVSDSVLTYTQRVRTVGVG